MTFTTRPELHGTFGMVASTHWIASAVGMKMLEQGGSAADAAVAMGLTLNVVEPHLNGPLGDMPLLVHPAGDDAPTVICGQGPAPAAATIAHYRGEGLALVPGTGLLAAVVPGAFDAWMLLLRDHGRLSLRAVMEPAIHYAEAGHPLLPQVAAMIARMAPFFRRAWPTSAEVWLAAGERPAPGTLFRNPALAAMWRRLLAEAEAATGRDAQIEAARRAFYAGPVAESIDSFVRQADLEDASGACHKGVLTGADMAAWRARKEAPLAVEHCGWTVWKCGPWSQGPALLQALRMLETDDLAALDPAGAPFIHLVTEALKRAFADREAYYGDPDHSVLPLETLLSSEHGAAHRAAIGETSAAGLTPGPIAGLEPWANAAVARSLRATAEASGPGGGEPTMAHLTEKRGDTTHLDVIDQWGNAVSATPSGGWLQSSPAVPGLGVPLNTRAQMFWLEPDLPTSLAPGRRPRTTLTPSMAMSPDGARLAFGTPGGDQQEQWQLTFLLRLIHHGQNLQQAIDGPLFHTGHLQASFHPRGFRPAHLLIEPHVTPGTAEALRAMGHALEVAEPWTAGRLTAVRRRADGILQGAATPRLMQAYAIGR